jgi:hypothetical protein
MNAIDLGLTLVLILALLAMFMAALRAADAPPPPPPIEDPATPYREGLHTAIRLQTVAQDLAERIYAEAERAAAADRGDSP